jgi:hypothetical protein
MEVIDWATAMLGALLIFNGVRAIRRRQADVPERYAGNSAVRLGWTWLILGILFACAALFDIEPLKRLFRLFLEAAN